METFEILTGIVSILSFLVSLFVAKQVINIKTTITINQNDTNKVKKTAKQGIKQSVKGNENVQNAKVSNE